MTFDASLDPKNLVEVDRSIDDALTLWERGEAESAIAAMRSVLARQPRMLAGYTRIASFLSEVGRIDEAIAALRQAVALGAADESVNRKLALLLVRQGKPDEAGALLDPYRGSPDPDTQAALGRGAGVRDSIVVRGGRRAQVPDVGRRAGCRRNDAV